MCVYLARQNERESADCGQVALSERMMNADTEFSARMTADTMMI